MKELLSIAAGILAMLSAIPYALDIIHHRSRPNVVSWFTWSLILVVATSAAFSAGATRTALFNLGDLIGTLAILLLGLRFGIARMTRLDAFCQAGAIVAFILWFVLDSPSAAIVAAIVIDLVAFIPTFNHAWQEPQEETWQTYGITIAAGVLVLLSLQSYTLASLGYPIYLSLANLLLVTTIIRRRMVLGHVGREKTTV